MKKTKERYDDINDRVVQLCLNFWKMHDCIYHDSKAEIFYRLYMDLLYKNYTGIKLCFSLHISESTLLRYKKLFASSVNYLTTTAFLLEAIQGTEMCASEETLSYLTELLLFYLEELKTAKITDDNLFRYGEKTAYIECLEIIQSLGKAKDYRLNFNIEKKYPL